MNTTTLIPAHLHGTLGSFWEESFSDKAFLDGWMQGLSLQSRQLDQNNMELEQLVGVQTTPVEHVELWSAIELVKDYKSGDLYPLKFETDGAKFGMPGKAPIYDQKFTFGGTTRRLGLKIGAEISPTDIMFISDSIQSPTFVWSAGVDYDVKDGTLVFARDVLADGQLDHLKTVDAYAEQEVYTVWAYFCTYDLRYMAEQWGYLLGYEQESSTEYNKALWELWKARRFGLTPDTFREIISIYMDAPRARGTEVLEELLINTNGTTTVITNANVYSLSTHDESRFKVGDTIPIGEFIGSRVSVLEAGKRDFTRDELQLLPESVNTKLLGTPGYIETNYIRFVAEEAPATIERDSTLNYTPSYARLSLPSGSFDVTVNKLHRYTQYDFTLEVDVHMLPAPGTQVGNLQVFSVTGIPLFSQPYTGNVDPVNGVVTLFTDTDDLLREQEDALEDLVTNIDRVVLITMFDDLETYGIKSTLEQLRFSDKHSISVTAYPSVSVYTDFPTEGTSLSTVSREQLLNYDLVLLNTGSGVMSTLDPQGELQKGPTLTDSEFIHTVVSNIDRQITRKRQELAELDNDLIWVLNYVNQGTRPSDVSWLYQLCGTHGVPQFSSKTESAFYNYGAFSRLQKEKITEHEENNRKDARTYHIPENPWPSVTGLGVITKEVNVPVYSKRIDISGVSPELETSVPGGHEYVYKVASLVKL